MALGQRLYDNFSIHLEGCSISVIENGAMHPLLLPSSILGHAKRCTESVNSLPVVRVALRLDDVKMCLERGALAPLLTLATQLMHAPPGGKPFACESSKIEMRESVLAEEMLAQSIYEDFDMNLNITDYGNIERSLKTSAEDLFPAVGMEDEEKIMEESAAAVLAHDGLPPGCESQKACVKLRARYCLPFPSLLLSSALLSLL